MQKRWAAGIVLILTACGYRSADFPSEEISTISVPYVQGDFEGALTDELIRQLSSSGRFEVVREGGSLILNVAIIGNASERIGYQYDRDDTSGKLQKHLFATENRRLITAELTLVDSVSEEVLLGPAQVKGSADYDYTDSGSLYELTFINSQGRPEKTLTFSLGQLDSIEGAQDDAVIPVYRELARKIVDGLLLPSRG